MKELNNNRFDYFLYLSSRRLYFFVVNTNDNNECYPIYFNDCDLVINNIDDQKQLVNAVQSIDDLCESFSKNVDHYAIVDSVTVLINPAAVSYRHLSIADDFDISDGYIDYDMLLSNFRIKNATYDGKFLAQANVKDFPIVMTNAINLASNINKLRVLSLTLSVDGYYVPKQLLANYFKLFKNTYVKVDKFLLLPVTLYEVLDEQLHVRSLNKPVFAIHFDNQHSSFSQYDINGRLIKHSRINLGMLSILIDIQKFLKSVNKQFSFADCVFLVKEYASLIHKQSFLNDYFSHKNKLLKKSIFFEAVKKFVEEFYNKLLVLLKKESWDQKNLIYMFNAPNIVIDGCQLLTDYISSKHFVGINKNFFAFDDLNYVDIYSAYVYSINKLQKEFYFSINDNKSKIRKNKKGYKL